MKKLLILPLLVLLTGCVTYYYPETALEDGVYYAEDDPSYVAYSGGYSGVAYYPWYSLDYFYLGYYPYPGYSIGYAYPSGLSLGFGYGFSPWYYPGHYYGYYSPWYGSYYNHYRYAYHPAWRPYRGYYSGYHGQRYWKKKQRHNDRYAGNDRHDGDDTYYGNERYDRHDRNDRRNRSDDKFRPGDHASDRRGQEQPDQNRSSTVRRYVSTAPGAQSGNRGVVIRNRESAKVGKSRLHVDPSTTATTTNTQPSVSKANLPDYSIKRTTKEVRERSDSKQGKRQSRPSSPKASATRGKPSRSTPSSVKQSSGKQTSSSRKNRR
jgi:hypothetical protein